MKNQKAALGNGSKPDLTHVRKSLMTYVARTDEYGSDKYERANYMRQANDDPRDTRANFERFRAYLRAALSHVVETLDAMEFHQANDPQLCDDEGMQIAAYAADTDATPGAKVGASLLPHVAHAAASLAMAIEQATRYGLLPKDPGQPWRESGFTIDVAASTFEVEPIPLSTIAERIAELDSPPTQDFVDREFPPCCGDQRAGYTCRLDIDHEGRHFDADGNMGWHDRKED